jgi:predicted HTH transcriptional regulator
MPYNKNVLEAIVREVCSHSVESPWIEFKTNKADSTEIGEYISALSNTATLFNKTSAFMIWGIHNDSHDIIGTTFKPREMKRGNESLDLWISKKLSPRVPFYFHELTIEGAGIVVLEISPAPGTPVKFDDVDFIRIDSNKKKLKDYPETERELWSIFSRKPFEMMIALENLPAEIILRFLNVEAYFKMLNEEYPTSQESIVENLLLDRIIVESETGNYNITNLGAILFANNITNFPSLAGKTFRVIAYLGSSKTGPAYSDIIGVKGYAFGFEGLVNHVNKQLPLNEVIGEALRKEIPTYPQLAIRELVANAMIHQNFFIHGASPVIEIFHDRIEITSPGMPLIDKARFIGSPPISRNEILANFMHRIGICEIRGSGFAKVIEQIEAYHLPAPEIDIYENHTKVTLYAYKEYKEMNRADRIRACYDHACIKRVNREYMTNASLRERLNIEERNMSMVSRLLKETLATGLIKIADASSGAKFRKYLPYWA